MAMKTRGNDPVRFIAANMPLAPAPALPEILLHTATPASGLWRLVGRGKDAPPPPYWAYHWAGGTVLARHILDRPETVRGLRMLDLGAGSGVVGIAAAKAGASQVTASDIDPNAIAATKLNAAANGVTIAAILGDLTEGSPPDVDLIAVGDLFYAEALALRVAAFLDRCLANGVTILVGDPGRAHLPRDRLRLIAQHPVPDFGEVKPGVAKLSGVFSFEQA